MIPSSRHSLLELLEPLVGDWTLEAVFDGTLATGGRTSFEWIDGRAFLRQFVDSDPLPDDAPEEWTGNTPEIVTSIIGLDDSSEQFTMLYADARDVFRV